MVEIQACRMTLAARFTAKRSFMFSKPISNFNLPGCNALRLGLWVVILSPVGPLIGPSFFRVSVHILAALVRWQLPLRQIKTLAEGIGACMGNSVERPWQGSNLHSPGRDSLCRESASPWHPRGLSPISSTRPTYPAISLRRNCFMLSMTIRRRATDKSLTFPLVRILNLTPL